MTSSIISVPEISCEHCKVSIEGAVGALSGVREATVSVPNRTVAVDFDETQVDEEAIRAAIEEQGYEVP